MEEPETQVQLDPWDDVPEAENQSHTPKIQTEQSSATGKGDNRDINFPNQASNEGRSTHHQDSSERIQGETQIGSFSNSSVPEVGGKKGKLPTEFNTHHQSYTKAATHQGQPAINLVTDKEDDPNKWMPIKELLKQSFREEMSKMANLNATNKWSYRDNPNSNKKGKSKKYKKLKQCTSEDPYVVEFPDEDEEMPDLSPNQNKCGMSDEELAREISVNLQIKRKRDETCQLLLEEGAESETNINNMQIVLKKQKYEAGEKWAEEAGPNQPHLKP